MTQPICRLIWSSRFWVRARVTGSSTVIGPSPTGSSSRLRRGPVNDVVAGGIDLDRLVGADQQGRRLFLADPGPAQAVARLAVAAPIDRQVAPAGPGPHPPTTPRPGPGPPD